MPRETPGPEGAGDADAAGVVWEDEREAGGEVVRGVEGVRARRDEVEDWPDFAAGFRWVRDKRASRPRGADEVEG